MSGQNHDENIGLFGIGAIVSLLGSAFEVPFILVIGLVIAGIGLFRVFWYS